VSGDEGSAEPGEGEPALPQALALDVLTRGVRDGITIMDSVGRLVYANDVAAKSAGYADADSMLANPGEWLDRLEVQDPAGVPVDLSQFPGRRLLRGEVPEPLLVKVVDRETGATRWSSVSAEPYHGAGGDLQYVVDTIQDVTDRVEAEAEVQRFAANQAFLAEAAKELGSSLGFEPTLQQAADLLVSRLADWCVVDLLEADGGLRAAVVAHADPAKVRQARELRERFPPDPRAGGGPYEAIQSGQTQTYEVTDELLNQADIDPDLLAAIRSLELRSAIFVPLRARGRILGALTLIWTEHGRTGSAADIGLAEEFAAQAALAIDNARLFAERDEISRALQTALMPSSLPAVPGFDLAAEYWPAGGTMEVGGDFYDAFDRPEGALGLVVGDVCGKGAEAAAVMGVARQTVRAAGMREDRPSAILEVLNEALLRDRTDLFCTACDVRLQPQGEIARIVVCLAGHFAPIVLRSEGTTERIGRHGSLLGVLPDVALHDVRGELRRGEGLVLFTDGLIEDRGATLEDELVAMLALHAGRSASELVSIVHDWHVQRLSAAHGDDAVVLVARFVG
jgi:serine phosphatase RsbU (regulator of sigma subunit)